MTKKKVLQLITLSEIGGAQKIVYSLVKGLDKNIFDVTVACAPGGEMVAWLWDIPSVKVIEIDEFVREVNPVKDTMLLFRLWRLIKHGCYDIVHCHSSKAGFIGRIAAFLAGVPQIIFTVHGWSFDHYSSPYLKKVFVHLEKALSRITHATICVSEAAAGKGLELAVINGQKSSVIRNGIEPVTDAGGNLRRELSLGSQTIVVGTVCRLAPPKSPLLFLKAAKEILKDKNKLQRDIVFVVIGDGPFYPRCREFVRENSLEKHIILLGNREDAPQLIADFDVFTLFSESEGLPIVIIEAMMAGKPVISSNVGGVGELVTDSYNGFLVSYNGFKEIVDKLKLLVTDDNLRNIMGTASKNKVQDFSIERMTAEYEKVYLKESKFTTSSKFKVNNLK